jgi:hypothetical protein
MWKGKHDYHYRTHGKIMGKHALIDSWQTG